MYKFLLFSILTGLFCSSHLAAQSFFSNDTINTVEINFFDNNWDQILDNYMAADSDEKVLCTMIINGEVYDSVGIKYKGNSSYQPGNLKNPFTVELDYINADAEIEGYSVFKLSNGFKDPGFTREAYGYELAGKYMDAPRAGYARVYINGLYHGFYTTVQGINKDFSYHHYYENNGTLIKSALAMGPQQPIPGCIPGAPALFRYEGADSACYQHRYELKSDYGWSDLLHLCDTLNNVFPSVEDVLNADRMLWLVALENLLVNLDSPINNSNNFYAYKDPRRQFHIMPWDLNEVFGVFKNLSTGQPGPGNQLSTTQLQQFDPLYQMTNAGFPAIYLLLNHPRYYKMYLAHYRTLMAENFTAGTYLARLQQLQNLISDAVQEDTHKFYSFNDFLNNITTTTSGIIGVSELMEPRLNYLASRPEFNTLPPQISAPGEVPEQAAFSTYSLQIAVNNATEVSVFYRDDVWEKYTEMPMYDDGSHDDGAADDGVYGAYIPLTLSDMAYYIYAENNEAGAFLPARAAHESYTIPVRTGIVINELMASNQLWLDEAGEAEDWIELYNQNDNAVSLHGFFLSDNGNENYKWRIPDVMIDAHSYLIIWADKDEADGLLHASFKLDSGGEGVVLSDALLHKTDEIEFPAVVTGLSWGRYPNGEGDFHPLVPSFDAENSSDCIGIIDCAGVCDGTAVLDQCGVCNGNGPIQWYADEDGDGLGNPDISMPDCSAPQNYVSNADDMDDSCPYNFYDCMNVCGGQAQEDLCGVCNGAGEIWWYIDTDNDGLGELTDSLLACSAPAGYVANSDDIVSGLSQLSPQGLYILQNSEELILSQPYPGPVYVTNIQGIVLYKNLQCPATVKISWGAYPAGIYLIQAGNRVQKICK